MTVEIYSLADEGKQMFVCFLTWKTVYSSAMIEDLISYLVAGISKIAFKVISKDNIRINAMRWCRLKTDLCLNV